MPVPLPSSVSCQQTSMSATWQEMVTRPSPRDHDLAVGLAVLDVGHRLESLLERERAVEDWTQHAVVVERRQPLELRPTGLHEEERVADPEPLGLPADLAADQGHHGSQERLPDLSGESGV